MPFPDRFVGTTPSPILAGTELSVHFGNSGLANTTVTIDVDNGTPPPTTIQIALDGNGDGVGSFNVPASGWVVVNLNHSSSHEHSVQVTTPP